MNGLLLVNGEAIELGVRKGICLEVLLPHVEGKDKIEWVLAGRSNYTEIQDNRTTNTPDHNHSIAHRDIAVENIHHTANCTDRAIQGYRELVVAVQQLSGRYHDQTASQVAGRKTIRDKGLL
jgi:hypothetical protein